MGILRSRPVNPPPPLNPPNNANTTETYTNQHGVQYVTVCLTNQHSPHLTITVNPTTTTLGQTTRVSHASTVAFEDYINFNDGDGISETITTVTLNISTHTWRQRR